MSTYHAVSPWIRVKPGKYVVLGDSIEAGVLISPYDIPNGVRGGYDDDLDCFVVEFRYMVNEEYRSVGADNGTRIRLGKHSSRIIGVEVDVDRLGFAVAVEDRNAAAYAAIDKAMQDVEKIEDARARRRENYVVAQKVLEDKQDEIFGNVQYAVAGIVADR